MKAKRFLARLAAALAASLAFATGAATISSADYSDLWWNPAENGWGAGLYQQNDVIFMTLYVYGPDGRATWFVAPEVTAVDFVATGEPRWQGTLYRVTGPWFGGPFDPAAVGATATGIATLSFQTPSTGTLSYTAGGVGVTKQIQRQSWRQAPLAGRFHGGMSARATDCQPDELGGTHEILGPMQVVQSGSTVSITVDSLSSVGDASQCVYSGAWSQEGRLGKVAGGNYYCIIRGDVDHVGTFTLSRVEIGRHGFYGHFEGVDQYCRYAGQFGGTRKEGP